MYKCLKCENVEFKSYTSLSRHMGRTHKMDTTQFYVDYNLKGIWPLCKCGCNGETKWSPELKGFREYCQGHQSRIHNNWGHNQIAIDKSAETRRQQYASGERKVWNEGLTKETNKSVKLSGDLRSQAYTQEIKDEYSDRMRENRLSGIIPTLHGKDHSQWKGGASSINVLARARKKLYTDWKYPILIRDGFKCVKCGDNKNLHIHHNKETMSDVIRLLIVDDMEPKTFEEKEMIADAVVDYHIKNKVSGITLCGECHNKIHPSLNFL